MLILVMTLAAACGKGKSGNDKAAGAAEEDPAAQFVRNGAKEDLAALKTAMAGPKPDSAIFKCAQMANIDTLKKADAAVAAELTKVCNHDLHVAIMKVEVEKAEAARKAQPDEKTLSECFDATYEMAVSELAKAGTADDESRALEARFAAACPK